jgi:hypothetical protein
MPLPNYVRVHVSRQRRYLIPALVGAIGIAMGLGLGSLTRDPHTATAERLTGTVTWSNAQDRMIAFEADGERRDPLLGDTFYFVVSDEANYPACLTGRPNDPVRADRRRIELEAIHQDHGGPQRSNFAVSVRCLDQ